MHFNTSSLLVPNVANNCHWKLNTKECIFPDKKWLFVGKEPLVVEVDLWLNSFENPVEKNNNIKKKNTQKPTFSVLDRRVPREKKLQSWNGKLYLHKVLLSSFPQSSFSFFRAGFFSCSSLNPGEHGNFNQGRLHSGYRLFQSVSQLKRFYKRLQSLPTPIYWKQSCVKYDSIFGR